jgi:Ca-activated chloride channel homolog
MKIDANDPKWTAYALGEITDEKERVEIESILAKSAEMRELVEEIRRTAGFLKEELLAEPIVNLTQAQRERIEGKAAAGRRWFGLRPAWAMACAAAAVMLISLVVVRQLQQTNINTPPAPLAQNPKTPAPTPDRAQVPTPAPKTENSVARVIRKVYTAINPAKKESPEKNAALPETAMLNETRVGLARTVGHQYAQTETPNDADKVKDVMETLSVKAAPTAIPTSQASTGAVLDSATLQRLPTGSASVMDVIDFFPGVVPPPTITAPNSSGTAGPGVAVIHDGISLDEIRWSSSVQTPSQLKPETIKEFKVILSPADAEYGRGSAQVQLTTKKGKEEKPKKEDARQGEKIAAIMPPPPPPDRWTSPPSSPPPQLPLQGTLYRTVAPNLPPRPPNYQGAWPPVPYHLGWFNTEAYDHIRDNAFLDVIQNALSTFSIDVDTASYSNMRRFLERGQFPPIDAVRIEELVNYFDYEYKAPKDGKPFATNLEITEAPWNPSHRLLRIALKGREINQAKRPNSNLIFLLDVSGSMGDANKLPLVKQSMKMLVDRLTESDRVAIVTYSTEASLYLPSTSGDQKTKLKYAIEQLQAGGSTNGAGGIQLAYRTAQETFIKGGTNRVILATDGDFNVGITDRGSLTRLIEEKAQSGIFLSALGYGMGNLKDSTLELLANKGRGNYAYIDNLQEAQKVLVDQMDATLIAIAKDVKIQVKFNPRHVSAYRLIGYEDRIMAKEDFNNDAKMAGVVGAGHAVTALYEIVPSGEIAGSTPGVDPLKYQKQAQPSPSAHSDEVATIKIRCKDPEKDVSVESEYTVKESEARFRQASPDFKFAAAVAAFGMILRNSPYKGDAYFVNVEDWAIAGKGEDVHGYRAEFIRLVQRARAMAY